MPARLPSNSRRIRRGLGLAALAVGLVLFIVFQWIHSVETRTIDARHLPDSAFPPEHFELIQIQDTAPRSTVHALFLRARGTRPTVVAFHGNGHQLSAVLPLLGIFERHGLGGFAGEYPFPVLVLLGSADPLIPARMGNQLASQFSQGEFVALNGVEHGAMIDSYAQEILGRADVLLR